MRQVDRTVLMALTDDLMMRLEGMQKARSLFVSVCKD